MPFKSKAQWRACFAKNDPNWDCGEWADSTPSYKELPKKKKEKKAADSQPEYKAQWPDATTDYIAGLQEQELRDALAKRIDMITQLRAHRDALLDRMAAEKQADSGRCWEGYEPVPGKEPYSDDSCRPKKSKKSKAGSKSKEK